MKEESRGHTNRVHKQQRNEVLKPRRPLLRRCKNNWLQVHRHAKTVERPTVGDQLSNAGPPQPDTKQAAQRPKTDKGHFRLRL